MLDTIKNSLKVNVQSDQDSYVWKKDNWPEAVLLVDWGIKSFERSSFIESLNLETAGDMNCLNYDFFVVSVEDLCLLLT